MEQRKTQMKVTGFKEAPKKKPVWEYKQEGIKASLWQNDNGTQTLALSKSWKDKKTDEWMNKSISLFPKDVRNVVAVLDKAQNDILGFDD